MSYDDEDDYFEDGESSREPMRPCESFYETTGAMLLVGRHSHTHLTLSQAVAFFDHVQGLGLTQELRVVPDQDFSRMPDEDRGEPSYISWAIGLPVAQADANDMGPTGFVLSRAQSQKEAAARVLGGDAWQRIADGLPEDARADLLGQQDRPLFVTYGPLASGVVAYGVEAPRKDPCPDGLQMHYGCDMSQEPHDTGVQGVCVVASEWSVNDLDLSDDAHRDRERKLGALSARASYYLISRYD